jgi:hypothetical protein
MREQRQNPVADQVGGGEVAGYQQQVAGNNDLALGQPILRLLGGDKRADEVVPCRRRRRSSTARAK